MFIKNESRPSVLVNIRLIFDDCVKDVTIKQGMYATFQYMQNGISNIISGIITKVAFHEDKLMNNGNMKPIRPITPPNAINNQYYQDISCKAPGHPCDTFESIPYNGRYYIEVDSANVYNSNKVKIYIDSIVDINVIYDKCSNVVSPEGDNQIQYIRRAFDGLIEYSDNGVQWYRIDGSNAADSNTDINVLKMKNEELTAKVEAQADRIKVIEDILKSLNITIPPVVETPDDENQGDVQEPESPEDQPSTDGNQTESDIQTSAEYNGSISENTEVSK